MSPLKKYILTRAVSFAVTLFLAVTVNFMIPRLIPGDPIEAAISRMMAKGGSMSGPGGKELVEAYKERFGLNDDIFTQYVRYLGNLMRGDLGLSIMSFPMTVQELILDRLGYTIVLLSISVILSWILGNLLGAFIGWRRGGKLDATVTQICLVLNQIPYYFLALILIFLLSYTFSVFPAGGAFTVGLKPQLSLKFIIDYLYHMILPALSIIISSTAGWMITMRAMIINVLGEDYLLLAEAKGLNKRVILMKYAFRNALLPNVTGLAMAIGYVLSGSLLTEVIFNYPGIGTLLRQAVLVSDFNTMQGIFLLVTFAVLAANFIIDLLYPLVDPRIKYVEE